MGNFFIVPPPLPSLLILPRKWETFLSLSNSPGVAGVTRKRRKKREKEDRKAAFAHRRERRKKCGTSALGWYVWCRHSLAGESPPFPPDPASHMRILPIFENAHGTLITQSLPSSRYPAFSLHAVLSSFSSRSHFRLPRCVTGLDPSGTTAQSFFAISEGVSLYPRKGFPESSLLPFSFPNFRKGSNVAFFSFEGEEDRPPIVFLSSSILHVLRYFAGAI